MRSGFRYNLEELIDRLKNRCACEAETATATWRRVQTMRSGFRYNLERLIVHLEI